MKKNLLAILLAGLFIAAAHGVCFGANLIKNGNFETITPDMTPSGWKLTPARNTEFDYSFDSGDKISGSRSLKVSVQNPIGFVTLSPENKADAPEPGEKYELVLWIKAENLDYSQTMVTPAVRLDFRPTRTRPMTMIDLITDMESNAGWQELSLQVTAPNDAQRFVFDIILTQGTVWIDDISLTKIE